MFPEAKVEKIDLPGLVLGPAIVEFEGEKWRDEVKDTMRIWPQDNDSEGFYVARIRKNVES